MSLIEIYNIADNSERQKMFYDFLKKTGLKESSYRQYAMTHPNNEVILNIVNEVAKKNSLFEVVDLLQVQNIYNKVIMTDANKTVNNALSATISNYKKFLDYLETETISSESDDIVKSLLLFISRTSLNFGRMKSISGKRFRDFKRNGMVMLKILVL